jgi:hypothetical protein
VSVASLPAELPSISSARLPASYEHARQALAECSRIDECQQWADKAEALASYARQANDDTLRKLADRIQARAIRRQGELLKQIPDNNRGRPSSEIPVAALPNLTRTSAAESAGISEHQRKTALRVASVPADDFERQVESESPPTVTQLAKQGTRPKQLIAPPTPDQVEAQKALAQLLVLANFCRTHDPRQVALAIRRDRIHQARSVVTQLDGWLDTFIVNLGDHSG